MVTQPVGTTVHTAYPEVCTVHVYSYNVLQIHNIHIINTFMHTYIRMYMYLRMCINTMYNCRLAAFSLYLQHSTTVVFLLWHCILCCTVYVAVMLECSPTCLVRSTLKGTPNLYFLSEVLMYY